MNLEQVEELLTRIRVTHGVDKFVVVGSLSVLGLVPSQRIPPAMLMSNELDAYPEDDPDRRQEIATHYGQGTEFERAHGYYFDPVRPGFATLPDGWEGRLIAVRLPSGVRVKFLEPNDAAVSKYARNASKDRAWIREGLAASILSAATIEYRFRTTPFLDQAEHDRAKAALAEDRKWLEGRAGSPRRGGKKRSRRG